MADDELVLMSEALRDVVDVDDALARDGDYMRAFASRRRREDTGVSLRTEQGSVTGDIAKLDVSNEVCVVAWSSLASTPRRVVGTITGELLAGRTPSGVLTVYGSSFDCVVERVLVEGDVTSITLRVVP